MEACCPCKRADCPRHGDCDACRAHHHGNEKKPLTSCEKREKRKDRKQAKTERRAIKRAGR